MEKVELPLFGKTLSFSLSNFEGPLELLLYLIQKEEIDLFDIPLKELTSQFFKELEEIESVDVGGDFIWNSSRLLLLKSRRLLPQEVAVQEQEADFRVEILQKLMEYARLKNVANELVTREESESAYFSRAPQIPPKRFASGLEEVKIEELGTILSDLIERAKAQTKEVEIGEKWEVGPKIEWLEEQIKIRTKIPFHEIFNAERVKEELIVFFLALLEMMKLQKIVVLKNETNNWMIAHAESL